MTYISWILMIETAAIIALVLMLIELNTIIATQNQTIKTATRMNETLGLHIEKHNKECPRGKK